MDFNKYVDYWQSLQEQHIDLNFFARMFEEELDDSIRNSIQSNALILNDYDGAINWISNGKWFDEMDGSITLLGKHSLRNKSHDDLEDLLTELKSIGFQLFAKIFQDIQDKAYCPDPLLFIDRNSIKYYRTPFILENYTGWVFTFKMKMSADADLTFNPAKWNLT